MGQEALAGAGREIGDDSKANKEKRRGTRADVKKHESDSPLIFMSFLFSPLFYYFLFLIDLDSSDEAELDMSETIMSASSLTATSYAPDKSLAAFLDDFGVTNDDELPDARLAKLFREFVRHHDYISAEVGFVVIFFAGSLV